MSMVLFELFILVAALGFGVWQLYDVNRELRKDREKARARDAGEDARGG